jgi:hypothetical protein
MDSLASTNVVYCNAREALDRLRNPNDPAFRHSAASSFQIAADNQAETDRGFRT